MQRHEFAQLALDHSLHGLPEPLAPWRSTLPARSFALGADLRGYLGSGRSPNIETMALAALLGFAAQGRLSTKEKAAAVRSAADLLAAERTAFLLNEFGSTIYSGWRLLAWCAIVRACELLGAPDIANGFRALLTQWLALARLSMAVCPKDGLHRKVEYVGKSGSKEVLDESKQQGRWIVTLCGERSWGHGHGVGYFHHTIARVAFGIEEPRKVRSLPDPGQLDGWQERALTWLTAIFRDCAAPVAALYAQSDWRGLVELLKSPPPQSCELLGYTDGSRVFVEGGDEPEPVDEDNNSNTPRLALMAVYADTLIRSLPDWPAPNGGATRIRQEAIFSDVDRSPDGRGWTLLHSHVGQVKQGDRWTTFAPEPVAPLLFRVTGFGGDGWVLTSDRPRAIPTSPAAPTAPVSPAPTGKRRRGFWRRLFGGGD